MNSFEAYLYSLINKVKEGGQGKPGKDGITPHIGDNGNWFIDEEDTLKPSRGKPGKDGDNATDEQVRSAVDVYMKENPVNITVDSTLTKEGKAADAKVTGDKILQYAIKNTVSGESPLTITDSAEEMLQDIKLLGKSEQTQTTGAQLIPFPYVDKDTTKNGVTFTVKEDGGIKVYGTSTETVTFILATIDYGTESIFNNGTGNGKIISGGKDNVSIEYHGVTKKTYLSIAPGKAVDVVIYPQLQNGSTATPYEPYTGGQPSPNPEYPQEIKNVGKYNEDTGKYEVDVVISNGGYLQKGSYANKVRTFPLEKGKTYRIYVGVNSKVVNAFILNEERTFNNSSDLYTYCNTNGLRDENSTGVISGECKIPSLLINGYTFYVTVDGLFLYQGINNLALNTDNAYITYDIIKKVNLDEPYKEQTVKLSLDQPLRGTGKHKDEITKEGIIRRVWSEVKNTIPPFLDFDANGNYKLAFDPKKPLKNDGVYKIPCDITTNMISYIGLSSIYWLPKTEELQSMGIDTAGTAEDARTKILEYLSKNPMTIQYALKEPIIEPLPEEFEQFLKLNSYYPTTVVSTDGGEVNPDIEVTYVADTKNFVLNKIDEVKKQLNNISATILDR